MDLYTTLFTLVLPAPRLSSRTGFSRQNIQKFLSFFFFPPGCEIEMKTKPQRTWGTLHFPDNLWNILEPHVRVSFHFSVAHDFTLLHHVKSSLKHNKMWKPFQQFQVQQISAGIFLWLCGVLCLSAGWRSAERHLHHPCGLHHCHTNLTSES